MTIHIEQLTFNAIIGLLDFERLTPQQMVVDVKLEYHYEAKKFINYAEIADAIEQHLIEQKYLLLEDALVGTQATILSLAPHTQKLWLKLSKPNILKNCSVALSHSWNF